MDTQHPLEGLMRTTLDSIKNMVDVNTILGDPVETPDGKVIMPISRVTFGFAAGGTEFQPGTGWNGTEGPSGGTKNGNTEEMPFGGGSGAGISIQPVAFLIVGQEDIRLMPVDHQAIYERLIDMAPKVIEQLQGTFSRKNGKEAKDSKEKGTMANWMKPDEDRMNQ